MNIKEEKIKTILLSESYITSEDLQKAEEFAKVHNSSFLEYLYKENLINQKLLGQAIAEYFKISYADLSTFSPSQEEILLIPQSIATKYHVMVFKQDGEKIIIATDGPEQVELLPELQRLFPKKEIIIAYTLPDDLEKLFIYYRRSLQVRFVEIIQNEKKFARKIIEEILIDTLSYSASDIHFEPQENDVIIRFRIDGVLHEAGRISKKYYENVLNHIKVQSNLRIDEHKTCQDGAIRLKKDGRFIDLRISIAPTLDGEKVTIRLLAEYIRSFTISDLGLSTITSKYLLDASKKPFGMILVVGPTGSGKTTTLYALLKILNRREVNITTIEDPVEYKVAGINQIQVNSETNISFAGGLRSIARQDPDIILVGEIRDQDTAEIAVNAALTGHLLLSSFHSNDAATAIPRLLDMGVEPFLVASSLELILAQRLVRKICENCRYSYIEETFKLKELIDDVEKFFPPPTLTMYKGKGCNNCNQSGFKGRTAIFEFIHMSPEMQDLILKNPSIKQIWSLAEHQGSQSLFKHGIEKVKNGITTLEELLRVATPPLFVS